METECKVYRELEVTVSDFDAIQGILNGLPPSGSGALDVAVAAAARYGCLVALQSGELWRIVHLVGPVLDFLPTAVLLVVASADDIADGPAYAHGEVDVAHVLAFFSFW